MNLLSMYSGIGALDIAAHLCGMTVVAMCDSDPFCRSVLSRHWPEVPIFESDEEVSERSLLARGVGRIDIIAGSPPCQPFSFAGKRAGITDPRHRWPQMARAIAELHPRWVFVENTRGFMDVAKPIVLPDLEGMGYDAWAIQVPAAAIGAPHGRARIFIVAHTTGARHDSGSQGARNLRDTIDGGGRATVANTYGGRPRREQSECVQKCANASESSEGCHPSAGTLGDTASIRRDGDSEIGGGAVRREDERRMCEPSGASDRAGAVEFSAQQRCERSGTSRSGRDGFTNAVSDDGAINPASPSQSRLGRTSPGAPARLDLAARRVSDYLDSIRWPAPRFCQQYDYEPPRVTTEKKFRRKRVKALGNCCPPQQYVPILAMIAAIEQEERT